MAVVGKSVLRTVSNLWRGSRMHQPAAVPAGLRQMSTSESILDKKLDGKVAIITGAAGAIGATTAKLFAAHGAQVIVADIAEENGHKICSEIGSNAHYRHCDVAKEEDVASTVDFVMEKFGKLDIMCNNAGVVTAVDTLDTLKLEDYDRFTAIMVRGVVIGIKHASRVMIPVKQGVILNTASTASVSTGMAMPLVYNINKSNLPGLTRIAAYHLGKHGIRVNAISPHGILNPLVIDWLNQLGATDFTHEQVKQAFLDNSSLLGRSCTEDDVAKSALFLCSDDSGYVSGQNLVVDGGWSVSKEYDVIGDLLSMTKK